MLCMIVKGAVSVWELVNQSFFRCRDIFDQPPNLSFSWDKPFLCSIKEEPQTYCRNPQYSFLDEEDVWDVTDDLDLQEEIMNRPMSDEDCFGDLLEDNWEEYFEEYSSFQVNLLTKLTLKFFVSSPANDQWIMSWRGLLAIHPKSCYGFYYVGWKRFFRWNCTCVGNLPDLCFSTFLKTSLIF